MGTIALPCQIFFQLQLINTEFMIKQSVQKAVIQLEDKKDNSQRATERIQILYDVLFQSQSKTICEYKQKALYVCVTGCYKNKLDGLVV